MRVVQTVGAVLACAAACAGPGDNLVAEAIESHSLRQLYDDSLAKAQRNKKDAASRYIGVLAYVEMVRITRHQIHSYDYASEGTRVLRMADQAVEAEPNRAYPLLAKAYLISTLPDEALGPRPPSEATRTEYRWFTETNPKTGTIKRERRLVYIFEEKDPRINTAVSALLMKASELEPSNPAVWLLIAASAKNPETKLSCVRKASRFGAKQTHTIGYLLQAYRAYISNGISEDAAIARSELVKRLRAAEGKVWVTLFRKVHKDFAAPS